MQIDDENYIDNENYFEIAEALHCYYTLNHEGQASELYQALCESKFKPGMLWSETVVIAENSYFHEITDNNWKQLKENLEQYLGDVS